jgi:hypothetical protein
MLFSIVIQCLDAVRQRARFSIWRKYPRCSKRCNTLVQMHDVGPSAVLIDALWIAGCDA